MSKKLLCLTIFAMVVMAAPVGADTLSGLADVTVVDGAIVSLRYAETEYVVADGDLVPGTTTRWYVPVETGVPTLWVEGDPAPADTVSGTSNAKEDDVGSNADNFLFTLEASNNISSIDGIDYQETIFAVPSDTFFLFERGGNDKGTLQAILEDGSLGEAVEFDKAADGGPYADTGISVSGQNAYGVVFTTDVPVHGMRITASGHDTLSISTPAASEPVEPPVTIPVDPNADIAAANEAAKAGDTVEFAAGMYYITSQIEIKDGVTYRGAGPGLTIIDGNDTTRAFVAWGDRSFNEDSNQPNDSGPKDWVLEGMTVQNCVADANNRFSYTGAAFNLKTNFVTLDVNESGGLDPEEANGQVGGIRLAGPDGTEGTEDDDLHRFAHIDTDGSGELSEAELDAQLLLKEDEFSDESGDGGAITIGNQAVGTIQNCDFLANHTPIPGDGDDGGAINIGGLSIITINDCWFDGNYACSPNSVAEEDETGTADGDGGHIKVQSNSASAITPGTTLIASRCVFLNGNASDDGGAIQTSAVGSIIRLDTCWFEGNTSWDNGNVCQFSNNEQNEVTVTNCIFVNNVTKADNSPDRMIETNRNSKFINCTFVGNNQEDQDMIYNNANVADTDGDGVDDETADVTQVINCIFANNVVGNGDDVLGSRDGSFTIAATNCLFFGNTLQNGNAADNTQRPAEETGSVTDDPLLDAEYVPGAGSPAIDAGLDLATIGITLMTDYNGAARPQGAAYDIGAFEVVAAPPAE
ncbi:MAG TPA: choice-of-anchor Q domain-containing protein [Sedimentisphaerales bacterium]|nr:choice-of-anchor Q domain-containing protein [Sedimentisphaerales bacterium]